MYMFKRIVFMGTPSFSVPSLKALIESEYQVVAVCTQMDKEAGRGRKITVSPVKELALHHGIPVIQPAGLRSPEVVETIREFHADAIVVASYGKFLSAEILEMPPFKCINVHPSLLPKYRGSSPVATAILNGDRITGVTIMIVTEAWDSGPVLSRQEVEIDDTDTEATLSGRLARTGAELLIKTLPGWFAGKITPQPQDETAVTLTRRWTREDGRIDWKSPSVELWRRVRAFDPWPGCFTTWLGRNLKITAAIAISASTGAAPGTVIKLPANERVEVGVACGDGVLGLIKLQMEGKKEMTAQDFVRGQREFVGSVLT
jgi:methionyl-tRNA formyltransferase